MAGETTNADGYSTTAYKAGGRQVCVLDVSHEVTTGELEASDVIQFGTIPEGAIYLGGFIATDDLDSNGTPTLDLIVGDDDDADGLQASGTVGQAAGITTLSGTYITNKQTTDGEKTIKVTANAAAATAAAGTIRLVVEYYVP
jgi:hypothetical protein